MRRAIGAAVCAAVLLAAAPAPAEPERRPSWVTMTVGDWRRASRAWQSGAVMGAMSVAAVLGVRCRTAVSASMVIAVLEANGDEAIDGEEPMGAAVWRVMGTVYGCTFDRERERT